MGVNVELI